MRLNANEEQTLRDLLLAQLDAMRKAEKVGMHNKLATYRARIDALDKVLGSEGVVLPDEVARVDVRLQEGRY
jgi:hypothetical protein